MKEPAWMVQSAVYLTSDQVVLGVMPTRSSKHSCMEIGLEVFYTVILSLPLIQEEQISVSGKRMCSVLVYHLED